MRLRNWLLPAVAGISLALVGCEPASITEARDQLGRGPARSVTYALPIARDTFYVDSLLGDDTTRTADGRRAVTFDPETVAVAVGEKLKFDNLGFSPFTFSYDQMLRTSEDSLVLSISVGSFTPAPMPRAPAQAPSDTIRFETPAGSQVFSATLGSGWVVRRLTNSTGCNVTVSASLVDSLGTTVVNFGATPILNGQTIVDSVDVAGKTMTAYVRVQASGSGLGACVPNLSGAASLTAIFRPLTLSSVTLRNLNEGFNQTYNALANEPRILAVDTVVVQTGSFTLRVQNRLPVQLTADIKLNGVLFGASAYRDTLIVSAAPGNGTTRTDSLVINLVGARIVPGAVVAQVIGQATAASATISPTVTTNAVVVNGGGSLEIQRVVGTLNPATTTELNVSVEEAEEIDVDLDSLFGDLADVLEDARLNDVVVGLTVRNGLGTKLTLNNFKLGVVELTAAGAVPRDGSGNVVFQKDSLNNPIQVAIADTGQTTLTVAARSGPTPTVKTVALQVAPVIDRVIDLLLQSKRAGLVAVGTATAGDPAVKSSVTRTDSVSLTLALTVALDITVPTSGVTFDDTQPQDGLGLKSAADVNEIASRVESASARSVVVNQTPFGVQVRIALVPDSQPPSVDADSIFRMSNRVELGPVDLSPAAVDAQGRVTQAVTDTVSVSMTGQQSRVLLGKKFTVALRVTLLPNASAGGRGAIRPSDRVIVNAGASVTIRFGGN